MSVSAEDAHTDSSDQGSNGAAAMMLLFIEEIYQTLTLSLASLRFIVSVKTLISCLTCFCFVPAELAQKTYWTADWQLVTGW